MSRLGAYLALHKSTAPLVDTPRDAAPPERAQHGHDLAVVDGVQQVRSAVAGLLADRSIGTADKATSERWYRDFALVVHGAADPSDGSGGGGASGCLDAVVAAGRSHDAARAAIGEPFSPPSRRQAAPALRQPRGQ